VILSIYVSLSPIDQVTVGLQGRTISIYQAQQLVNFIVQTHSDQVDLNKEYLNVGCNILRSKSFFTGVMKVYEGRENQLSSLEKNALKAFKKPIQEQLDDHLEVDPNSADIVANILAKSSSSLGKHKPISNESSYYDLDFIPGTSCEVERLFSISRYILSYNRSAMTPTQFEKVIFLKMNKQFWDATLVSKISSSRKKPAADHNDIGADENARNDDSADPAAEHYDQIQDSENNEQRGAESEVNALIAYDQVEFENSEDIVIIDENEFQGRINRAEIINNDLAAPVLDDQVNANPIEIVGTGSHVTEPSVVLPNQEPDLLESDLVQLRRNQSSVHTFERTSSYAAREASLLAKDPRFNAAAVQPMHDIRQVKTNPRYISAATL
jgi:hypothetical protein